LSLIGWDLGSAKCGWAAGAGDTVPVASGFRLDPITPAEIGDLGSQFTDRVMAVHKRFPKATHWISERPLLVPTDHRFTLEQLMGLSFLLATLGRRLGKTVKLVENGEAKMALAGRHASKDDMVRMAEHLGVKLPVQKVDGREDAADAVGVWLVGIRLYARQHLTRWDQAIYSNRGGLL